MADYYVDASGNISKKKKKKEEEKVAYKVDAGGNITAVKNTADEDDIAPVKKTEEKERTWFQAGAFEDGYQFGDVLKTVVGTASDIGTGIIEGGARTYEGMADAGAYLLAGGADLVGADSFADNIRKIAQKDEVGALFESIRENNPNDDYSILGEKSRGVSNALGQILGVIAGGKFAQGAGAGSAGVTATTTGMMGVSSAGLGISEAYKGGATDAEATTYGISKGIIDATSELIFGGLGKAVKATGLSHGVSSLDDVAAKALSDKITARITSETAKRVIGNAAEYGVKASAEGLEEVIAGVGTIAAKKLTYMSEEDIMKIYEDENLLEQFIVGAVTSGIAQAPGLVSSTKTDTDFVTGRTSNEDAVLQKEVENRIAEEEADGKKLTAKEKAKIEEQVEEDLEKGRISTDTIEAVLGGDTYKAFEEGVQGFENNEAYKEYQKAVAEEEAIRKEFEELQNVKTTESTIGQQDRFNELKARIEEFKTKSRSAELRAQLEPEIQRINGIKKQLQQEVSERVKGDRLYEGYRELQRSQEKFQADVSKYENENARKTIQNLMDGGIANNTNEFHEFADMLAKWSADKGLVFDMTDNQKLFGTRYAKQNADVNGFLKKDGTIVLNKDSKKRLNSVAGHEITHVLEGTKFYQELADAVKEYATKKGEYDTRLEKITKLYAENDPDADPVKELTADLVGDYIFTDKAFIENLSVNHRNIFQYIWDEITYMAKTVAAGSKEERILLRAKKAFADAYRTSGQAQKNTAGSGAQYDITVLEDGKTYVSASRKVINGTTEAEQRKEITQFFNDLLQGNASLDIQTIEGDVLTITKADTADKARDDHETVKGKRVQMTSEKFAVKLRAEAHIDELAETSIKSNKAGDYKNHSFAKDGFTYRKAYFEDFDGQFYEITLSIGHNGTVATVYNVGKIEKGTPPSATIVAGVGSKPLGGTPSADIISQNSEKSSGEAKNSLSPAQEEYFKDSVVRDEDGNLKVMYHGTSRGGHTVFDPYGKANYGLFGAGSYFTDNPDIAQSYTKKGKGTSPQVYETYLNITNPIDMDAQADAAAWAAAMPDVDFPESGTNEDFYRAMEEYFEDMEYPRWEAAETAMGVIEEMGFDGITHIGGGRVDADGVRHRVYIAFQPEQIKAVDNASPTSDPDIRFSLSENVEETRDLIAMHNVHESKLMDALRLGGLPSPSVAITKMDIEHSNYGAITLILPKDSIDPQADSRNKVYGSDAWTPTSSNARTEYEVNFDKMRAFEKRIAELGKQVAGGIFTSDSMVRRMGVEDVSERNASDLAERMANQDEVRAAYLAATGKTVEPEYRTKEYNKFGNDALQVYIDRVGAQRLASVVVDSLTGDMQSIRAEEETVRQIIRDNYAEKHAYALNRRPELKEQRINRYMENNVSIFTIEDFVKDAWKFYEEGGAVTEEIDRMATSDKIRSSVTTSEVKAWLEPQIAEFLGEPGIYNGKDLYTPSGKRRSFAQTHYEYTAENIVKAMQQASARGETFGGTSANTLIATATPSYKSIDEIHAAEGRLKVEDKETYDKILADLDESLTAVEHDIMRTTKHTAANMYDEEQIIGGIITEAATGTRTEAAVQKVFAKNGYRITAAQAKRILHLYDKAASVPTGYFEAKPERVVGFEEVAVFIIPRNADVKLKQELLNHGYSIAEYDPEVDGDRSRVVNQFEQYKFSLSDAGTAPARRGRGYAVYGDRIRVHDPAENDFAPLGAYTAPVQEDIAPVANDSVNEVVNNSVNTSDVDYAPYSEAEAGALRDEGFANITDADAPPEVDAPYYGEEGEIPEPDNPFEDRDIKDVGSQKVKAYMYENPEVKPFFQAEANVLLGEWERTTRGERFYNAAGFDSSIGGEGLWMGTSRNTSADIAYLRDELNISYDNIKKGLENIIKDDGAENNAVSKRIEFLLNDRLLKGYVDFETGMEIPPNPEYVRLLNDKQILEYSEEARARLFDNADAYAPPVEDIAPVREDTPTAQANTQTEQANTPTPRADTPTVGDQVTLDGEAEAASEPTVTRKSLHESIISGIKARFAERGFDLDVVLEKAKDLSTFATVDNTPQRVLEKSLGYKEGQILSDITVNKVAQNETEGIRWLNSFTDRKRGLLAQISREYNIRPGSKKSAAAQMYAEGFYVDGENNIIAYGDAELAKDFPNARVREAIKGLAKDERIRRIYDETLEAINASRRRNAYPEIPRLDNYFLHFRAMEDTFSRLGLPFNPNDIRAKDLPTDLNGVTADLKPGQPYFASAMHRTGKRTSFDLLGGLEKYLGSAKNQIYHIDDIQKLRALRNYIADTYGQAHGLEDLDTLSDEEAEARIKEVYDSHLSTMAKFLNEEANVLAGKTSLVDRGLEGIIGRRGITTLDTINRQVGANMVGFNVSSSLTNFLSVVQAAAKTSKFDVLKAFAQTSANKIGSIFGKGDGFAEASPVMIRRKGIENFYRTPWQKASDAGYILMSAVDEISTELIARTKYNELTRKGMDAQKAHVEVDKWVSRLMGDRSLGQQPQLYNSKMLGLFTKFQLEVRNQLDSMFYDTIQEAKVSTEEFQNGLARNAAKAAKITSTMVQLAVLQHVFGKAFESVAGYNPSFDIIDAIMKAFGWDDEEDDEDTVLDNIEQGFLALLGDLPYTSTLTGGRVPIESALPIEQFVTGKDSYGNEKSRWETLREAAPYYLLPGGYGQIKKTKQGLGMFSEEHPVSGSYTDSGNLRYPVEDTPLNKAQAAVFGQYASSNARDYFDNERSPLKEKQIEEFMASGMSIQDYWDYREGLSDHDKLADKAEYIADLDVPLATKNLLINNIAGRKEPIDMADYSLYADFEEFDYASKNPEKYAFLKANNVSYADFAAFDEDTKEAWNWAYNNPEGFALSKAAAKDVVTYRKYAGDLNDITADKDEDGKSISGSRKEKVFNYINNLDADYGEKIILFKNEYNADDTYNYDIIEYLDSREDISYEEMVIILTKLGFKVSGNNVTW